MGINAGRNICESRHFSKSGLDVYFPCADYSIHAQIRAQITVYIHCADYSICTYTENTCSIPTHVEVIYNIIHFVHDNGGKSGSFTNKETVELNLYFVVL